MNKICLVGLMTFFLLLSCQKNAGQRPIKQPEPFGQKWGQGPTAKYEGKGKVKAVVEYNIKDYTNKEGNIILNKHSKEIISVDEFTEEGYLISAKFWSPLWNRFPDQHMFHDVYLFNNGKPFKLIHRDKSADREYSHTTEMTVLYDDKGNITHEVWEDVKFPQDYGVKDRNFNYFRHTTITKYDDFNCPVVVKRFNKDNGLEYEIRYKYNNENRVILEEEFQNNKLIRKKEIKNGENGVWYLTTTYGDKGTKTDDSNEVVSQIKDSIGNVLEKKYRDGWSTKYLFKDNKEVGYEKYRDGNFYSSTTNTYREDRILLQYTEVTTDPTYDKKSVFYTIDEIGNWTEEVTLNETNQIINARYRVIYYY